MGIFKCKMCGGNLETTEGSSVGICEYCGTKQTVPTAKDENLHGLYNRANTLRIKSEFDKAEQLYEKILQADGNQAEAYWGLILCKYGIEYVEDPATFKRIPTCHRASYDSIIADDDYKSALKYADGSQRNIYEQEAKEIDRIQKEIIELSSKEEPYDVFICYKETDDTGSRTQDSVIANDIYYQLTQEGFKVFYAAITLEDKLGSAYEPCIFAALNSAKVMLAIGTKPEYLNAVWVKNEWSRYLKIMKKDRSKLLIPCYKNMDAYDLPDEFAHLQAQDMGKIGFINDVVRGIKKVVAKETSKSTPVVNVVNNTTTDPLLKRAFIFLEDGDWNSANEYCEKVLDIDPECAQAYLGKLMAELHIKKQEYLQNINETFENNSNYSKIIRYADDKLRNELIEYIDSINAKTEEARKNNILAEAKSKMVGENIADYECAIQLLESISGWKDSFEIIASCKNKIADIRTKAEAEQLEKQRQKEIAEKEKARIEKRNKKIALITTPIVAVIVAVVILLTTVIVPNSKYNNAIALLESGNILEAYEALVALNGYKDSSEKAASIFDKYKDEKLKINNVTKGDYLYFGMYEQDNNASNGKEDIEWLVLEIKDGKALVISKYALDCKRYNESYTDVTWETSSLRSWLNNDFIVAAFSNKEQAMLAKTTVNSDENKKYNTNPGNITQDKVFLLSIQEAQKYFTSDEERVCSPTNYVQDIYDDVEKWDVCWWWLRSPGASQSQAAGVYWTGSIQEDGSDVDCNDVVYTALAVRPAIWIELNS